MSTPTEDDEKRPKTEDKRVLSETEVQDKLAQFKQDRLDAIQQENEEHEQKLADEIAERGAEHPDVALMEKNHAKRVAKMCNEFEPSVEEEEERLRSQGKTEEGDEKQSGEQQETSAHQLTPPRKKGHTLEM
ncbi:hypothetical protein CEE69_30790 [Rhodopirellula bahusiensis]|uniref:Uncharacterized protein n=2 Tax=Rhodopirellula bahusiensis TaxID=2014065 RepID=A0A2G1VXZ0_9BACT|nr:hypothetical protein CEE69_30790 [Rhodopirellula bahusiensis]